MPGNIKFAFDEDQEPKGKQATTSFKRYDGADLASSCFVTSVPISILTRNLVVCYTIFLLRRSSYRICKIHDYYRSCYQTQPLYDHSGSSKI